MGKPLSTRLSALVVAGGVLAIGALPGCASSGVHYMSASSGTSPPVASASPGGGGGSGADETAASVARTSSPPPGQLDDDDAPTESFLPDDLAPAHILDRPKATPRTSSELSLCEGVITSLETCVKTATVDSKSMGTIEQALEVMRAGLHQAARDPVKRAMLAADCEDAQRTMDTVRAKLQCSVSVSKD